MISLRYFGVSLGPSRENLGLLSDCFGFDWDDFGILLGSIRDPCVGVLGSIWGRFGGPRGSKMRKTTISKKGAKEEMKKHKIDQARSKKRSVELKKILFWFFSAFKSSREASQGVGFRGGWYCLSVW